MSYSNSDETPMDIMGGDDMIIDIEEMSEAASEDSMGDGLSTHTPWTFELQENNLFPEGGEVAPLEGVLTTTADLEQSEDLPADWDWSDLLYEAYDTEDASNEPAGHPVGEGEMVDMDVDLNSESVDTNNATEDIAARIAQVLRDIDALEAAGRTANQAMVNTVDPSSVFSNWRETTLPRTELDLADDNAEDAEDADSESASEVAATPTSSVASSLSPLPSEAATPTPSVASPPPAAATTPPSVVAPTSPPPRAASPPVAPTPAQAPSPPAMAIPAPAPTPAPAPIPSSSFGGKTVPAINYTSDSGVRCVAGVSERRCHNCKHKNDSSGPKKETWRRSKLTNGKMLCNPCGLYEKTNGKPRPVVLEARREARNAAAGGGPSTQAAAAAAPSAVPPAAPPAAPQAAPPATPAPRPRTPTPASLPPPRPRSASPVQRGPRRSTRSANGQPNGQGNGPGNGQVGTQGNGPANGQGNRLPNGPANNQAQAPGNAGPANNNRLNPGPNPGNGQVSRPPSGQTNGQTPAWTPRRHLQLRRLRIWTSDEESSSGDDSESLSDGPTDEEYDPSSGYDSGHGQPGVEDEAEDEADDEADDESEGESGDEALGEAMSQAEGESEDESGDESVQSSEAESEVESEAPVDNEPIDGRLPLGDFDFNELISEKDDDGDDDSDSSWFNT